VFSEFIHVNKLHFSFKFFLGGSFDGNFRNDLFIFDCLTRYLIPTQNIIIPSASHLDYNLMVVISVRATYNESKLVGIKSIKMHGLFVWRV